MEMSTRRQKRVGDLIQEEISDMLQKKLEDPRLQQVTITGVEVSPDLRYARIWYSVLGGPQEMANAAAALKKASSLLRRELSSRITLRYMPELAFRFDDSWQRGARVDELLDHIAAESQGHESSG